MSAELHAIVRAELGKPVPAEITAVAQALHARFGDDVTAILFYGATLRAPQAGSLLDFYVVADDLRRVLPSRLARLAARVLPPNVYAVDAAGQRCKVAVIAARDFARGMTAFAPHLWARFAQPIALAYARDAAASDFVVDCLTAAARTAIARGHPLMTDRFAAEALWTRLFTESYSAELRPESGDDRAQGLVAAATEHYRTITMAILGTPAADGFYPPAPPAAEHWALRRAWGKLLNAARLMKAAFTYDGGLDYAVAKIARHSGVTVAITDRDRRRPLLGGIRIFLEARRKGGLR